MHHKGFVNASEFYSSQRVEEDIEHGYASETLKSDDSEEDGLRRKYERFNIDLLNKDFKWKLGLEFGFIKEFKEAILEYNVLNGKEIRFDFNDKKRVRARCKHCVEYSVYVSKVSNCETYRLNTLHDKHACGRVFHKTCAKSSWVAKLFINKMKATTSDMALKDIVGEIQVNYSTGISMSRAWRAKQIAKGFLQVFEEFPVPIEHRFCLRHLYNNFKKKFGGGVQLRDLMMGAAKATYEELWKSKMQQIRDLNEAAYWWLYNLDRKAWCKHKFSSHTKCDLLMNNLSEAFNSTILVARDKPIITMFEWIRMYLMNRFSNLRDKCKNYTGQIMPKLLKRLDWEVEKSGNWVACWGGDGDFEVSHLHSGEKFIVDINQNYCSCNF
uniref:Transposase MuDR plant domain-containing protein n=2 Tax=Cajanus cajan TaxID=3821 RepID=A0A151RJ27_CAJCA|nr:hypothetical protein KK1_036047 [Cajanus cajan]KYP42521.1 hypothetical protein KK1_036048 [Cajanus cajan]